MTGPSGSGKTTCYSILNSAYEYIQGVSELSQSASRRVDQKQRKYPFVSIRIINPKAYSHDEVWHLFFIRMNAVLLDPNLFLQLFGYYEESDELDGLNLSAWKPGVLPTAISKIEDYNNAWLVDLHPDCDNALIRVS